MDRVLLNVFFVLLVLVPAVPKAGAVEIVLFQRGYVAGGTGPATELTDAAVKAFRARRPDVTVKVAGVPWGKEGDLKLRTALLARRRIDCFRLAHDQLPAFLPRAGRLLAPVDPYLSAADRADFGAAALAAVSREGRVWAWPLWSTALALVANQDLLTRHQIQPPPGRPWTWAEFRDVLKRVSSGKTHGLNAAARPPLFEWAPLLLTHCGPLFVEGAPLASDGTIPLAPHLAQALSRVCALREAGLLAPGFGVDDDSAVQADFLAGRTAFLLTSPGFIKTLVRQKFPFAILPPPTGDWGRPITTGALGCFAVVDAGDAARTRAAQALCRFLTSAEIARAVPGWYLAPPARGSIPSFYDQPATGPLAAILKTTHYLTPPVSGGFMDGTLIPNLQAALLGERTPEQAIAAIQSAARRAVLK